ncbi:MAG: ArnT family glycosyltransferase [Planctomycetota bacterium]
MIARIPCGMIAVGGTILCYHWATRLYGRLAGVVAAVLWATCPYVLGHGCLVGSDVAAGVVGAAAVYSFGRWLRNAQWLQAIIAGVVLGFAELCKFTLLVFYPLLPILWFVYRLSGGPSATVSPREWLRQCVMLAAILVISVYVINCGYLFEGSLWRLERFQFKSVMFSGCKSLAAAPAEGTNRFTETWLGKLRVPLPAAMVQGIDEQRFDFERGLPSYLRGKWKRHGWWYYYLYALAIKMPLGTLVLMVLAVGATFVGHGRRISWRDEMVVVLSGVAVLMFVSSQTGFSIHSRYVIPVLPFLFVCVSKVAWLLELGAFTPTRIGVAAIIVASLMWSVFSSLWSYPHSLSYFNELVRGPKNGGGHLLDSNIDWGQDLLYLKDWLDEHPEVILDGMACYSSYPPSFVGIARAPLPPPWCDTHTQRSSRSIANAGPRVGWFAISITHLNRADQRYRSFRRLEPTAMAGYSIYIYHITQRDANRVRRELGLPELPEDWQHEQEPATLDDNAEFRGTIRCREAPILSRLNKVSTVDQWWQRRCWSSKSLRVVHSIIG